MFVPYLREKSGPSFFHLTHGQSQCLESTLFMNLFIKQMNLAIMLFATSGTAIYVPPLHIDGMQLDCEDILQLHVQKPLVW